MHGDHTQEVLSYMSVLALPIASQTSTLVSTARCLVTGLTPYSRDLRFIYSHSTYY